MSTGSTVPTSQHQHEPAQQPARRSLLALCRLGAGELVEGLANWRIWHLMGTGELRRRYARSRLGQGWLVLSNAITIVVLGLVWSLLWKMPIADILPYIAVGHIAWQMMATTLLEATTAFTASGHYFLNQRMVFSTAILAVVYRNLIALVHNLAIVVVLYLVLGLWPGFALVAALVEIALATLLAVPVAYLVAILCTRFRDVTQIVTSALQIAFFLTPVLWKEEFMPAEHRWIVDYNPLAHVLAVMRDPLLSVPVATDRWLLVMAMTVAAFVVALPIVGALRRRIIYWI